VRCVWHRPGAGGKCTRGPPTTEAQREKGNGLLFAAAAAAGDAAAGEGSRLVVVTELLCLRHGRRAVLLLRDIREAGK
jgi:hypothetical protein